MVIVIVSSKRSLIQGLYIHNYLINLEIEKKDQNYYQILVWRHRDTFTRNEQSKTKIPDVLAIFF